MESNGPYLSLVVVTRHDTNPGLLNTKFRLNFGRAANPNSTQTEEEANSIIIGRSSTCNMILDYRTVSTVHAKIHFNVRNSSIRNIHTVITLSAGRKVLSVGQALVQRHYDLSARPSAPSVHGAHEVPHGPHHPYSSGTSLITHRTHTALTSLSMQAKRSWTSAIRGVFGGSLVTHSDGLPYPTAMDVFNVLLDTSNNTNKADPQTSSNILEADGQALSR